MAYDSQLVANYFIKKAQQEGKTLTPMQLQKLVYFAHGWYLALFHAPLIRENIEAWAWGPVVPSLYREFKRYGDQPIGEPATVSRFTGTRLSLERPSLDEIADPQEKERLRQFLDRIWLVYSPYTAAQLSNMTHAANSPWQIALEQNQGARSTVINNELIQQYFEAERDANQAEAEAAG